MNVHGPAFVAVEGPIGVGKSTLANILAGVVAALRRAPARSRHSVWAAALSGALLLPVLAPWVPDWTIAALPAPALRLSGRRSGRGEAPGNEAEAVMAAMLGELMGCDPVGVTEMRPAAGPAAAGYEVVMIDAMVEPDYQRKVLEA